MDTDIKISIPQGATYKQALKVMETALLDSAMRRHKGNKTKVATMLGLSRVTLRSKLTAIGYKYEEPAQ
jgi:DNA-binding protein Fis